MLHWDYSRCSWGCKDTCTFWKSSTRRETSCFWLTPSRAYIPDICACEFSQHLEGIDHASSLVLHVDHKRLQRIRDCSQNDPVTSVLHENDTAWMAWADVWCARVYPPISWVSWCNDSRIHSCVQKTSCSNSTVYAQGDGWTLSWSTHQHEEMY